MIQAWAAILLGAILGGIGFRLRGWSGFEEAVGRGGTTARIACWAVPMGGLAWIAGHAPLASGLIALGLFLGCLPPWWRSITLGRSAADGGALGQYARHAGRGLLWTLPAAVLLAVNAIALPAILGVSGWPALFHSDASIVLAVDSIGWPSFQSLGGWPALFGSGGPILLAGGLACVPAYEIGWRVRPMGNLFRPGATEVGEVLFGAAMGVAVAWSAIP